MGRFARHVAGDVLLGVVAVAAALGLAACAGDGTGDGPLGSWELDRAAYAVSIRNELGYSRARAEDEALALSVALEERDGGRFELRTARVGKPTEQWRGTWSRRDDRIQLLTLEGPRGKLAEPWRVEGHLRDGLLRLKPPGATDAEPALLLKRASRP